MINRFNNLKIVKKFKSEISPKFRWLTFANKNADKTSKEYIQMVSGVELQSMSDAIKLEAMVREQLKAEIPNVESMKSYELLVDAVMHNIKKKQLQAMENLDIE